MYKHRIIHDSHTQGTYPTRNTMRSTIINSVLISSVVGLLAAQQAGARMISGNVERSLQGQGEVFNGHLRLLSKRDISPLNHRRHQSRGRKRSKCPSSSGSSISTTVSAAASEATATSASAASDESGSGDDSANYGSSTASAEASTSTADASNSTSAASASTGTSASSLGSITGFQGTNTGIGSWFQTDSTRDDTDGTSWCQLKYQDTWMGFAPDVQTMLDNFGSSGNEAQKAYCGREAKFTDPTNGNTALGYIVDGFATEWVRTPGSVDMTVALFTALYGSFDDNKDTVIQNLQWEFTGNVNEAYTFNS